jgi:hypothetical protein
MIDGQPTDDVPHDFVPTRATSIAKGVTLWTKNGQTVGNAIVVRRNGNTSLVPGITRDFIPLWMVETDFGNVIPRMTEQEIHDWWELGNVSSYDAWWDARFQLIRKALEDDARPQPG